MLSLVPPARTAARSWAMTWFRYAKGQVIDLAFLVEVGRLELWPAS
jgi:hypothetical protein